MTSPQLDLPLWMKSYVKLDEKNKFIQKRPKISKTLCDSTQTNKAESADVSFCNQFWQIAEFSEKLLLKADREVIVIGLDIDWASSYKSVLSKSSEIHICYEKHKCCFLKVLNIKALPKSLILLLNHPKVTLAGYNLSDDIVKLEKDFNFDVKPVLQKIRATQQFPDDSIFCSHNWDLESATEKISSKFKDDVETAPVNTKKILFRFPGKLKYSNNLSTCGAAAEELLELAESKYTVDNKLILGFDLEWPFSYKSGSGKVALVQICADRDFCYLLHIPRLTNLPKTLVLLLNHKNIKLVGVNIANDIRKIGRDFKIETSNILENNIIELEKLTNKTLNISERWSLSRLVLHLLGKELEKPVNVRCSDWSQDNLSGSQLMYAATDAYAGVALYNYLKGIKEGSPHRKDI